MRVKNLKNIAIVLVLLGGACSSEDEGGSGGTGGSAGGSGGSAGRGGSGGSTGGVTGGSGGNTGGATGGSGGTTGGAGGTGGSGGSTGGSGGSAGSDGSAGDAAGGSGGSGDGGTKPSDGASEQPPAAPPATGQGPVALGRIAYSQDFEMGMVGINRGPRSVPAERVVIEEDPLKARGKVIKVIFQQGDNYRTSPGTEPRTWISNRDNGHEFPPGTKVSHAFGVMTDKTNMNYCFAQVISTGGPVWMLIGGGNGQLTVFCNACGDANTTHFQLEPNKWHDFRVDMDFRNGGAVQFFHNGRMFRESRLAGTRGTMAHWDGGIYNRREGTNGPTRTVWISNLSVGIRE